jgi:spore germination protein GerM
MNGRRLATTFVGVGLLATLAAVTGCGVTNDPQAKEIPANQLPFGLAETTTSSTTLPPTTTPTLPATVALTVPPSTTVATYVQTLYFVADGHVRAVDRTIAQRPTLDTAIGLLAAGPTTADGLATADGVVLTTRVAPGLVLGAARIGGTAIVTVGAGYAALDPISQLVVTAQLVLTVTDLPGVGRVSYLLDGNPQPMWLPDGSQTDQSVAQDDYRSLLASP